MEEEEEEEEPKRLGPFSEPTYVGSAYVCL